VHLTVSIGVSEFSKDMRDAQALLDRADKAMYAGKQAGKDRVVVKTSD
jgi:diguanylate cyclase (GGDEF)-like protein